MSKQFIAVYYRHRMKYEDEFDSAKEAAQFLYDGEMNGSLSYRYVIDPSGVIIADHKELGYEPLYALGATDDQSI